MIPPMGCVTGEQCYNLLRTTEQVRFFREGGKMDFIGVNHDDKNRQLKFLGLDSEDALFSSVPEQLRVSPAADDNGVTELQLRRFFSGLQKTPDGSIEQARRFIGAGAYNHFIPACVDALASDSSFTTAYTPYQPEASQGTLQALFEYQTFMGELLMMDVVNASHYDGGTALAEAVRMAFAVRPGDDHREFAIIGRLHPEIVEVLNTYCSHLEIRFCEFSQEDTFSTEEVVKWLQGLEYLFAGLVVSPDFYGSVIDYEDVGHEIHRKGGLFLVHTDPLSCVMFEPPGSQGADIVSAEGQPFGIPLSYGGPYLGILACKEGLVRKLPGRLCGETVDDRGQRGFVLTLSTREQHIRRERATSNICTNQGLMALRALLYMAWMGKSGLHRIAELCYYRANYLARKLAALPGVELVNPGAFFREFCIRLPRGCSAKNVTARLTAQGFEAGVALSRFDSGNTRELLIAVTEVNTRESMDALVEACTEVLGKKEG